MVSSVSVVLPRVIGSMFFKEVSLSFKINALSEGALRGGIELCVHDVAKKMKGSNRLWHK